MTRFVELSHPIVEGMETYRPLPTPRVEVLNEYDASRYDGKSEFHDDVTDLARPAHTRLLGAGVPICEHMTNLAAITTGAGGLHAVPIAWIGGATFPVRAYLVL